MKRIWILITLTILFALASCTAPSQPTRVPVSTVPDPTISPPDASAPTQAGMPNPASTFCEDQGYRLEIRTALDGSQSGYCIFPDGSECDEWAYFRGECGPSTLTVLPAVLTAIPTAMPINAADYQGWWSYTHPVYGFSIMLPEDWVVTEITSSDPLMNGHTLKLGGKVTIGYMESIRMTFRRTGEDVPLWPTGVGQGEFVEQGTLDVAGEPARRMLLVCPSLTNPNGDITSIWYHNADGQPNIVRGDLEFGFIFQTEGHCEPGYSLSGKIQRMGEMIIASLKVP
jgi:putative hemolysin